MYVFVCSSFIGSLLKHMLRGKAHNDDEIVTAGSCNKEHRHYGGATGAFGINTNNRCGAIGSFSNICYCCVISLCRCLIASLLTTTGLWPL